MRYSGIGRIKKLGFDFFSIFFGNNEYGLNENFRTSWAYPIDYEFALRQEEKYYAPKDEKGIPMSEYSGVGTQYNATCIASFGLAHHARYLKTNADHNKENFLKTADWFVQYKDGRFIFDYKVLDLEPPWISSMSQGQGISILVRAYELTKEQKYLDCAIKALQPFSKWIKEGGVRSKIEGANDFLEEFPGKNPTHVLNGFLYAVIGIIELQKIHSETYEKVKFSEIVKTLQNWRLWDLGHWSAYDLHQTADGTRNPSTVTYHRVHITQIQAIATMVPEANLVECNAKWIDDYNFFNRWTYFFKKIRYRLKQPAQHF